MTDKPPSLPGGASIGWEQSIEHKGTSACADDTSADGAAASKPMTDDRARELARVAFVWAQSWKGDGAHFAEQDPTRGRGVHQNERVQAGELARRLTTIPNFAHNPCREWLTMSAPPAWKPAVQTTMFAP
jgi:hypothetical protein